MDVSLAYGYVEVAGTCGHWFIHCPCCGAKFYILIPKVGRIIHCNQCLNLFIEGGVDFDG